MCSVHEQPLVPLHAEPSQPDKVPVGGHHQHAIPRQLLYRHHLRIGNALQEQMNILIMWKKSGNRSLRNTE
jgi:hypothetical protein